ncbi:uncharacterized protein BDV14DRAFT_194679 [Aspergillus stella-maris]|uniref:uncharacterized protein n=1 Tax=Aspergillus stella-maris TaxID=1810926 RepID=UPI003CCCF758
MPQPYSKPPYPYVFINRMGNPKSQASSSKKKGTKSKPSSPKKKTPKPSPPSNSPKQRSKPGSLPNSPQSAPTNSLPPYAGPLIVDSSTWTPRPEPTYHEVYVGISPLIEHLQSTIWTLLLKTPQHTYRAYHLSSGPINGLRGGYRKQISKSYPFPHSNERATQAHEYAYIIPCGFMPAESLGTFDEIFLTGVPAGPNNFFVLRFLRVCVFLGMLEGFGEGIMRVHALGPLYNPAEVDCFRGNWTMEDKVFVERWVEFGDVLVRN